MTHSTSYSVHRSAKENYWDALAIAREALKRQPAFTDEYDATLGVVAYLTFAAIDEAL